MSQYKRIVADIDPRMEHQPALGRLRQIATNTDTTVSLLACDQMDSPSSDLLAMDPDLGDAREDYAVRLEAWLDKQAEELRASRIDVDAELKWHAPRYEAILEKADERDADLVLRSARHHSRIERLLVSATDWELIRRASRTVWLVKQSPAAAEAPINVLAAVDPVHAAEKEVGLDRRILRMAEEIRAINGGNLHVMHAWQPGSAIAPAIAAGPHVPMPLARMDKATIDTMRAQREALLEEVTRGADLPADNVHLLEGPVTDAIDALVERHGIDVVVAGGVSRGRIERLIIGSTAEAILENVDCDVVVVKPDQDTRH